MFNRDQIIGGASSFLRRAAGPLLLVLTFLLLSALTWRKWPDLLVDFGRELYIPWQLAQGQVLYRDLAHHYGPLSSYLNAALFRVFGVSCTVLFFSNLAALGGMIALLYGLLAAACDRLTATAAGMVFLLIFGFAQHAVPGSMNFISPYSHEATQGLGCSLLLLYALSRFGRTRRRVWAGLAGFCLGLVWLTKPELFLAATGAAFSWWLLQWRK